MTMDQSTIDMAHDWLNSEGEEYDEARLMEVAREIQALCDFQDAVDRGVLNISD